jgi:hypothetical protein
MSDVKVVGLKPCSLNDILHILKELEYTLSIIPHPKRHYFIFHLQTYLSIRFAPLMLNARIFIEDFEYMWKIHDREFHEYLTYNISCGYIFLMIAMVMGCWNISRIVGVYMHCGIIAD